MKKFALGKELQTFILDMNGTWLRIIKYHPYLNQNKDVGNEILFHVPSLYEAWPTFDAAVVGWMVRQHLGPDNNALTSAICRILKVES